MLTTILYYFIGCVMSDFFVRHVNFFNVRPRRCSIDFTHIPIARDSLLPRRAALFFSVFFTFLIQRQNLVAVGFPDGIRASIFGDDFFTRPE